ncbi:MAG: hypothetical protein KGD63_12870 [Candidatus Lokiarchaeota archaeon]|nr:hypothetical protein [Candidatus Lokiarchaeota archaeon]
MITIKKSFNKKKGILKKGSKKCHYHPKKEAFIQCNLCFKSICLGCRRKAIVHIVDRENNRLLTESYEVICNACYYNSKYDKWRLKYSILKKYHTLVRLLFTLYCFSVLISFLGLLISFQIFLIFFSIMSSPYLIAISGFIIVTGGNKYIHIYYFKRKYERYLGKNLKNKE